MNLLLDTHAVIWFITENDRLPAKTKRIIEEPDNECFVSVASFWEMAIKYSLGRLDLTRELKEIFGLIVDSGLVILPISIEHILTNVSLEFHHNDPFDRLIISQAKNEGFTLVSKDDQFQKYGVPLIW